MAVLLEEVASLTAQNQITIPAPIRKALKLQGGSKVSFSMKKDGTVVLSKRAAKKKQKQQEPALAPFLRLLDADMRLHPERIKPFPVSLYKKMKRLVRNVKVDIYAPLPD